MPTIICLPDDKRLPIEEGETILAATLAGGIPHAHACGGHAKCSTCRIWILEGLEDCLDRTEAERSLAVRLGFGPELRLACQTRVVGDVKLRRLVLDETDLEIASQLEGGRVGLVGDSRDVAVLFSDIRDFTRLTGRLSAYDIVFVLSRYFHQVGEVIESNRGYVVDFFGDGVMALFGVGDDHLAPLRSVKAGLEIQLAVERFETYMRSLFGEPFRAGVGIHYGSAVVGSVGTGKREKLTAIGETVNIANRVEAATKASGSRILISDDLYDVVREHVAVGDFLRVTLEGTRKRRSLYEVTGLSESGERLLGASVSAS